MIHTARASKKFRKLARALMGLYGCSRIMADTLAIGHLERLWHLTMVDAPRGDLGRQLDDLEIADECGWEGEPRDFIAALVDCGWLDRSDEHRLIVHDWHEHAPGFVKKNIARRGGFISAAQVSHDAPQDGSGEEGRAVKGAQVSQDARTPNVTQPNQTKSTYVRNGDRPSVSEVVVTEEERGDLLPWCKRIAETAGKKLTKRDREMCYRAAAVAVKLDRADWLDTVLSEIADAPSPPENPWAYIAGALKNAADAQGWDWHSARRSVRFDFEIHPAPEATP